MNRNKSTLFWLGGALVVVVGLLIYPKIFSKNTTGSTSVPCLKSNVPLLQHIHPQVRIITDGIEEKIPANIGLAGCERAIHTHDSTGELHVEAQDRREYVLGDFFEVWQRPLEREGYSIKVTADGELLENPADLIFKDRQQIVVEYQQPAN